MVASVSSGRSPATAGSRLVTLAAFSAGSGTSTVTFSPAPSDGLGVDRAGPHGDHRGVAVGLRLDGERATEDGVDGLGPGLHIDHVDQQTRTDPGGEPARDLLAVGAGGQQNGCRTGGFGQRGEHVDGRGDQVVLRGVGFGDVDLGGAGRLQSVDQRVGRAGLAHHDGGGLAQNTCRGDQFGGDLLQSAISVLDEHQYFSHELFGVFRLGITS